MRYILNLFTWVPFVVKSDCGFLLPLLRADDVGSKEVRLARMLLSYETDSHYDVGERYQFSSMSAYGF